MSDAVELIWYGDDAPLYDHGPEHPLRPARVTLTRQLIHDYGIVDLMRRRVVELNRGVLVRDEQQGAYATGPVPVVQAEGQV